MDTLPIAPTDTRTVVAVQGSYLRTALAAARDARAAGARRVDDVGANPYNLDTVILLLTTETLRLEEQWDRVRRAATLLEA